MVLSHARVICEYNSGCICSEDAVECTNVIPKKINRQKDLIITVNTEDFLAALSTSTLEKFRKVMLKGKLVCERSDLEQFVFEFELNCEKNELLEEHADNNDNDNNNNIDEENEIDINTWMSLSTFGSITFVCFVISLMCGQLKAWRRMNRITNSSPRPPCIVKLTLLLQIGIYKLFMLICKCRECQKLNPPSLESKFTFYS